MHGLHAPGATNATSAVVRADVVIVCTCRHLQHDKHCNKSHVDCGLAWRSVEAGALGVSDIILSHVIVYLASETDTVTIHCWPLQRRCIEVVRDSITAYSGRLCVKSKTTMRMEKSIHPQHRICKHETSSGGSIERVQNVVVA